MAPGPRYHEGLFFAIAVTVYARATTPRDARGHWIFVALLAFVGAIRVMQPFSPPPPSVEAVAITGLALGLLPVRAQWVERHRSLRAPARR